MRCCQETPPCTIAAILREDKAIADPQQDAGGSASDDSSAEDKGGGEYFRTHVLEKELQYIEDRRRTVFERDTDKPQDLPESADKQLLGLAFSGGGIRSATFNLGVLQALERHGVFKFVDYLSTVSGGGFLGCSLSTLLSQKASEKNEERSRPEFPFRFSDTEEEVPAVSYLRNNSNYLAPRGLLDYLRIFAVLVRGIILNFLVLLPFLLVSSMIVTVIYGQALLDRLKEDDNRAEVTDLLERNWIGVDSEKPVENLLKALELRGMLDSHRGMTRHYVVEWLRGDEKRSGKSGQTALPSLIKGNEDNDDEHYDEYEFRSGVTMEGIVERLWESGTLRNLASLREIDSVELAVRTSKIWRPSGERPRIDGKREKLGVANLYDTLKSIEGTDPRTPLLAHDNPARLLYALRFSSETLITKREGELGSGLEAWLAAGNKPNLRRILQELYARGFFNPAWLRRHRRPTPTGILPALYWDPHELAAIENPLLREALMTFPPGRQVRLSPSLASMLDPERQEKAETLLFPVPPGRWVEMSFYPLQEMVGNGSLHQFVHALWDDCLIDEGWLAAQFEGPEAHPLAYAGRCGRQAGGTLETTDRTWDPRTWNPYEDPLRGTRALLLVGLLWVLLYPLLLLVRRMFAAIGRLARRRGALWWRNIYEQSFSLILVGIAGVAFFEIQPLLIYHYRNLQGGDIWWPLGIGFASLVASMIAGPAIAFFRNIGKTIMLIVVGLLGPILPLLVYIHLVIWVIYRPEFWSGYYLLDKTALVVAFGIAAVVVHFLNLPIDVNSTSLHGFYRDRLSTAYLMRSKEDGSVVAGDDLPLSELCASSSGAPYQLINTTLNLQGSKDPNLRRRRGDFFQLSKYFVGSKHSGYCRTDDLRKVFPHVHVSTAMAVSAAAAAPNMGTFTSGPLVVLMALLNIRLGYWIPNPLQVNRQLSEAGSSLRRFWRRLHRSLASAIGFSRTRPGAYVLLKEMLSLMRADSRLVNLSDGGHMENTGVFELLRRRCQFIIVGDAEADPEMRFGGLAALIRYARIDFGIEIEIHVDDLRLDQEGESRQHCAIGVIRYPETKAARADVGYLLYIKSSITGDESEIVSEYHRKSPLFPHESTADQSFDEGQFEAYRDLGYHICDGLFDELDKTTVDTFEECSEWFEILSISLSPGLAGKVAFADIQSELGNIERMLREPGYSHYFYEIYPELKPVDSELETVGPKDEAEAFRNVFHLVNIQLQLMESLFVSSELGQKATREHPANRGWMNLFRRWAKAPSFKRAYLPSITTYSAPFQQFCQAALGLGLRLEWETLSEGHRIRLAGSADEIGLQSLKAPAPKKGLDLILIAHVEGTDPILIGETVVTIENRKASVVDFELRAGYQGAGMRARAMLALKGWARRRKLVLSFSEAAAIAAQGQEFDRDHSAEHDHSHEIES